VNVARAGGGMLLGGAEGKPRCVDAAKPGTRRSGRRLPAVSAHQETFGRRCPRVGQILRNVPIATDRTTTCSGGQNHSTGIVYFQCAGDQKHLLT